MKENIKFLFNRSLYLSVFCQLLLTAETVPAWNNSPTYLLKSRSKRFIAFPEGSSFTAAVCMTIGVLGNPSRSYMSMGLNWGMEYDLPNTTWLLAHGAGLHTQQSKTNAEAHIKRRHRRELYGILETLINRCFNAQTPSLPWSNSTSNSMMILPMMTTLNSEELNADDGNVGAGVGVGVSDDFVSKENNFVDNFSEETLNMHFFTILQHFPNTNNDLLSIANKTTTATTTTTMKANSQPSIIKMAIKERNPARIAGNLKHKLFSNVEIFKPKTNTNHRVMPKVKLSHISSSSASSSLSKFTMLSNASVRLSSPPSTTLLLPVANCTMMRQKKQQQQQQQQQHLLSRSKRYLSFPEGSSFSVAVCFTVGIIGNPRFDYMSFGLNWGVSYDLPNATWILNHLHGFAKPHTTTAVWQRRSRRSLYHQLETVIDNMGYSGRDCILRSLCESRQYFATSIKLSMVGEMLKAVFSLPKRKMFTRETPAIGVYDEAYRKAKSDDDCSKKYNCIFSLLELALGIYSAPPENYYREH